MVYSYVTPKSTLFAESGIDFWDGYKVKRVLNLTDVGHLVSDGDEGEDKLEKGAAREGKSVEEVMSQAASVLQRKDVMEGVADMITLLQVEAVFSDGSRLISIHHPIK